MRARPVRSLPHFSTATNTSCPAFQLTAASQASLGAANPCIINFYFTPQRLAFHIDHGAPELMQHHPGGLVT
jgi:hypothetical protein